MSRIIESITITDASDGDFLRYRRPHPGDHVRFLDGRLGRIEYIGTENNWPGVGKAHVCEEQGSAYLLASGNLSISGGPFRTIKLSDLEPAHELHLSWLWQWQGEGTNHTWRGGGMGCRFALPRPIFDYRKATA